MQASRNRRPYAFALATALVALAAAGCGGSSDTSSKAPDYAKALKSAPPPLAAIYKQTDYGKTPVILDSGLDGLNQQLAKLKGHPAVVNVWGSWCNPCRQEFPYLQKASAKFGDRVAFLGIDTLDQDAGAKTYLGEEPVPYPSYADPDGSVKSEYTLVGTPATLIYDSSGKLVSTHQGPYTSEADLAADIQKYAQ
jgi:cytochrome c biogenesis protein CcmG, thiol:disulfide interchange protein DsbE